MAETDSSVTMIQNTMPLSSLLEELMGSHNPTVDLNSNIVKGTAEVQTATIPVIDIGSSDDDDSGLELGFPKKIVKPALSPSETYPPPMCSPLPNCEPYKSGSAGSGSPNASAVLENPIPSMSELSKIGVKDVSASFLDYKPTVPISENPIPSISELSKLGVKNVSASFLDYKPKVVLPSEDVLPSDIVSPGNESYLVLDLSPTEEIQILHEIGQCPNLDENSLSSLDSGNVPSPETEALLLHESDKSQPCEPADAGTLPPCEYSATKFSGIVIPSPPPAYQLLEKADEDSPKRVYQPTETRQLLVEAGKDSFEEASRPVQTAGIKDVNTLLMVESGASSIPSPDPAEPELEGDFILDEVLPLLLEAEAACTFTEEPTADVPVEPTEYAVEESTRHVAEESTAYFEEDSAAYFEEDPNAYVAEESNAYFAEDSNAYDVEESNFYFSEEPAAYVPEEPTPDVATEDTQPKSSWAEPWISTDEAENADNNDPAWDELRRLETDEERYRVVKNQWRQKKIPNPRINLTCHNYNYGRTTSQPSTSSVNSINQPGQSRKRARSNDDFTDDDHPSKRRRTYSCTQMYENKINQLRQSLDQDFEDLNAQHELELTNLSYMQNESHERLIHSNAPPYVLQKQFDDLVYYQEREVDDLRARFRAKIDRISRERNDNINILMQASDEVFTFNKFYSSLGDSNEDHRNISEEDMQQFEETEQMFEAFDKIYTD